MYLIQRWQSRTERRPKERMTIDADDAEEASKRMDEVGERKESEGESEKWRW